MTTRENYIQFMRNQGLSSRTIEKYAYQVPDNFNVQNVLSRLASTLRMRPSELFEYVEEME